jgi:3-oxoacyl-[acyl-carrier-protein] synthase II
MSRIRVVITGIGVVSPIGNDLATFWNGILEGRNGVGPITRFDASEFRTRFAMEVKDFDPETRESKDPSLARSFRAVRSGRRRRGDGG